MVHATNIIFVRYYRADDALGNYKYSINTDLKNIVCVSLQTHSIFLWTLLLNPW